MAIVVANNTARFLSNLKKSKNHDGHYQIWLFRYPGNILHMGHNSQAPYPFSQSVAVNTFNLNQLADAAKKRLSEWIARSAGQHQRAVRAGFLALIKRTKEGKS